MRILFQYLLILMVSLELHATDSCSVIIKVDCPRGNSDFWDRLILAKGTDKSYYFFTPNKRSNVKKGQYHVSIKSNFGDRIDTIINLESENEQITINVPFRYIFEPYSSSVFLEQGNSIEITYTRYGCCSACCCMDRDFMTIYKDKKSGYLATYYEEIIRNEMCDEYSRKGPNTKSSQLDAGKTKIIDRYFKKSNVPYDKKKVLECIVKIDKHIYIMDYNTYEKFRSKLLN